MLVRLTTPVLKQREVSATVSSFHVSVLDTAMLRTSIAAVVLGCFYFYPLDCDASVMVVYCAAVETGCMLEKYKKVFFSVSAITNAVSVASILLLLLLFRKDMQFYFLVGVLRLLIIFLFGWVPAAAGACAADISTEAERGAGYCFILPRFRLLHCDASVVTAVVLGCFYLCPLDLSLIHI